MIQKIKPVTLWPDKLIRASIIGLALLTPIPFSGCSHSTNNISGNTPTTFQPPPPNAAANAVANVSDPVQRAKIEGDLERMGRAANGQVAAPTKQ